MKTQEPWVKIEKRIIGRNVLNYKEKIVLETLICMENTYTASGEYFTKSKSVLAKVIGMDKDTLSKQLKSLETKGLIKINRLVVDNQKKPLQFKILWDNFNSVIGQFNTSQFGEPEEDIPVSDVSVCHISEVGEKSVEGWPEKSVEGWPEKSVIEKERNKKERNKENNKESVNISSKNNISYKDQKEVGPNNEAYIKNITYTIDDVRKVIQDKFERRYSYLYELKNNPDYSKDRYSTITWNIDDDYHREIENVFSNYSNPEMINTCVTKLYDVLKQYVNSWTDMNNAIGELYQLYLEGSLVSVENM